MFWLVGTVSGVVALADRLLFRFLAVVLSVLVCADEELIVGCGVGISSRA
ncbi:hypothetical protein GCM10023262_11940 [Bartonella pachyuromydis]|uniref:Uncharacterized protein n=1 Tax=Bartonella pachyuromydis TaxID=931097 RepID=A0ABP8VJD0_9HYPH